MSRPRLIRLAASAALLLGACEGEPVAPGGEPVESPSPEQPPATANEAGCSSFEGVPWREGLRAEAVVLQEGDPRVEAVVYPHPEYDAKLWSQWGQGLVLEDGRFLSAIGDHLGADGNSYFYEYVPDSGALTMVADVLSLTDHQPGSWGYGKIHGQVVAGPCGEAYAATYWGDRQGLEFGGSYRGDLLLRLDPGARTIANLGVPVEERGLPSLAGWTEGGLVFGEAPDPTREGEKEGDFFAYDVSREEVVFRDEDPSHVGFRNVAVDTEGRAYYSLGGGALARYEPGSDRAERLPGSIPGDWLRASTRPAPDGTVYGATRDPEHLFALEPDGEIRDLGPGRGYTTSLALHPDGDRFFYVPDAAGGSWEGGAPLIAVDTESGEQRVVVELNPLAEAALGLRLGGSYNVAVDPSGRVAYVGMNAGATSTRRDFGEVVLFVVHL